VAGPIADAIARQLEYGGNPRFEAGCRHKIAYGSEREAHDAARRMHSMVHRQFQAYACPFCGSWHVGGRRKDIERRLGQDTGLANASDANGGPSMGEA
jgi:hypothetical protein